MRTPIGVRPPKKMTSGFSALAWVSSAVKSCWSAVTPKLPRIFPPPAVANWVKYFSWPFP